LKHCIWVEPGLDPYAVLEVHANARAEVIEAAFTVLREMAAGDVNDGARWLARLNWARRVLLSPDRPG
ncbi:MAG: hypothetical protein WCK40_01710, partial [Thermoleophilia bacterium]